jgi:hypothetical protein
MSSVHKRCHVSQREKHRFFSMKQASVRKDMECAFDLLKKRFNILVMHDRFCSQRTLILIMCVCIILHNMIIDDERNNDYNKNYCIAIYVVASPDI